MGTQSALNDMAYADIAEKRAASSSGQLSAEELARRKRIADRDAAMEAENTATTTTAPKSQLIAAAQQTAPAPVAAPEVQEMPPPMLTGAETPEEAAGIRAEQKRWRKGK